jgi:hypothetical protein
MSFLEISAFFGLLVFLRLLAFIGLLVSRFIHFIFVYLGTCFSAIWTLYNLYRNFCGAELIGTYALFSFFFFFRFARFTRFTRFSQFIYFISMYLVTRFIRFICTYGC